ncbi:MAG TPA: hypothetical protein VIX73_32130, partial [Kofleriaceae bacterium]
LSSMSNQDVCETTADLLRCYGHECRMAMMMEDALPAAGLAVPLVLALPLGLAVPLGWPYRSGWPYPGDVRGLIAVDGPQHVPESLADPGSCRYVRWRTARH